MKKLKIITNKWKKAIEVLMVLFIIFSSSTFYNANVFAADTPPRMISYQGRILNANGVPISDATIDIVFEFYDALAAGTCLWSNSASDCSTATAKTVTFTDGLFTQKLGDISDSFAAIPTTIFDDASVYLQVTIDGETLTPRKRLVASPYAMNADMLDGLDSTSFFGLGSNNTITGANDFTGSTFSGALPLVFEGATADDYETIFAITDPTLSDKTITFQNASGTVAYLNDIGWTDGGSTVYATTSTDDVAIGGTVANASTFGVAPSTGYVYFGSGSINPTLTFKDATAGTGTLTYSSDSWGFADGYFEHSLNGSFGSSPSDAYGMKTVSGLGTPASGGAGTYGYYGLFSQTTNSSVESMGYDQAVTGIGSATINSGTGAINIMKGMEIRAINSSTAVSPIENTMYGLYSEAYNSGVGSTIPTVVGVYGKVLSSGGTISSAFGVQGEVSSGAGTITTGYGGDFSSKSAGINRYGVRGTASGGTNNYAGYFFGSAVHVENSSTPSTANYSTGSGDLYVYDQLEVDGTGQTGGFITAIVNDTLTTGSAVYVSRDNSATDFINASTGLVSLSMGDGASTGNTLYTTNSGTGYSLYVNQVGDQQAMYVSAFGTTDYIASFFNDGNADTNMGISIQACLDSNPTDACNYLLLKDGSGDPLGAIEGTGGGVALVSPGSDYAELFPGVMADFSDGDVIGIDSLGNATIASNADKIIGAYSISPNVIGNWFEGWRETGAYVPVALLGQVPINVNDEGGAITAGDYLTLSSTPGVVMKANGVGYVIGRALESHLSGTGRINVYVQPKWQAINVLAQDGSMTSVGTDLVLDSTGTADAVMPGLNSYGLMLRGSGWDGASAQDISMGFVNSVTDASNYQLSFRNTGETEVGFINQDGDMAISGRLYPSDRGVLQTDKYIYYDGSSGLGGDFMRTNASGWGSGSYDFAEMFPVAEPVAPGEVVVFASSKDSVKRSTGTTYDAKIAGIVSTQPGFLAGNNIDGHVPIALSGRVPTYVSNENGSISIGDPLTTSSKPGYAMKATESGPIVGYAMEAFSGTVGSISVFVRPSYFDGQSADLSDNSITQVASSSTLDLSGIVNLSGGSLLSVGSIAGIGNVWSISEDGTIKTGGRFVQNIKSYGGERIEAYAVVSPQTTIELSGTIKLQNGRAHVIFADIDPNFEKIIDNLSTYRVFLTADAPSGSLYAINRDSEGFIIKDTLETNGVNVDWLVIAYHKDYAPDVEVEKDNIAVEEENIEENVVDQNVEIVDEDIVEIFNEPVDQVITEDRSQDITDVDEVVDEIVVGDGVEIDQEEVIEEDVVEEEAVEDAVVEDAVVEDAVVEEDVVEPTVEAAPEQVTESIE
ncbi:hypothetical protein L6260_03810 [Candidatus Parcubacteria bacterium]|nr:hypothetical protein [Candidatus Parcubacteria bacterium]